MFVIPDELKHCPFLKLVVERDRFARLLGAVIEEIKIGYAKVSLIVEEKHFNGVDIVQGGVLFTLADYALALACNTYELTAVSIESSISFMKPTKSGRLFAAAEELSRSKSLGSYNVRVINEKDELVAQFYGRVFFREIRKG